MLNRASLHEALKPTPDCLAPEQLEKLAEEAASHPHVTGCPRCQAELALLRSFEANERLADEGAAVAWISSRMERNLEVIKGSRAESNGASSWFARWFGARWLIPAVGVVAVAVAAAVFLHRPEEPALRADAGNGPKIYRSLEVEADGPAGDVAEAPKTLRWKTFPGAAEYNVTIMEIDETPLWTGSTRDMILTIPEAVRAKMLPGKPVLWRVTARDGQGRTLAMSQLQRFSVLRKSPGASDGELPQ